ncbi:lipopolysaccharide transport periplasmic protein LptA [Burkholderiaceae bacterium DAT-1]|nr:lipopolysaccharide transport periplasmic protein LptA [Burkholderiaceae bacterium DAT-1]
MNLLTNSLVILMILPMAVHAEKADREKDITIGSVKDCLVRPIDKKTPDLKQYSCEKDVSIQQGTMEAHGDKLVAEQQAEGQQRISLDGVPVSFKQKLDDDRGWINAKGSKLVFETDSHTAHIAGGAWIKTDSHEITASRVSYNSETEEVHAVGETADNPRGRVHIEIKPRATQVSK